MASVFGKIIPPESVAKLEAVGGGDGGGIFVLLSTVFKLAGVIAGIFFIIKIILAGFSYLNASGDEKKTAQAWATIWQSIMGFTIVASAFVIASAIGYILGINVLNPTF
jgi:hypothetical protein